MITNYQPAVHNIQKELKSYLLKSKLKSLVLGVSGGIDSAITAALARPVCDEIGVTLFCRSITISTNKPDEIYRAASMLLDRAWRQRPVRLLGVAGRHLVAPVGQLSLLPETRNSSHS